MSKLNRKVLVCLLGLFVAGDASAGKPAGCKAKRDNTKLADFGKTAMPLAALGVSLLKEDWFGAVFSQVLANGLYPLNNASEGWINKKRPCGCRGSFPSGHMIMYAASSSYLHYRYSFEYGLPAYIATVIFAADRVNNKAHDWGDMLGTFAIVNVFTYFITPQFKQETVIFMDMPAEVKANLAYLEYAEKKTPEITPSVGIGRRNFMAGIRVKI